MNKLKNVFQRSSSIQKNKMNEERRPQQFVKRHSQAKVVDSTPTMTLESAPAINLADLSEMEKPAYTSWWKDLDPFDIGKINNSTVLKFLNGCSLPDNKLEQILALFETAGDGLNKLQFFAMLRLIAHAQNGRKISRALVYLGAPIPHFHTNAIDALIKSPPIVSPSQPIQQQQQEEKKHIPTPKAAAEDEEQQQQNILSNNRKSWWGNEKIAVEEQEDSNTNNNRHSYIGPFTAHTPIPNSPFHNNNMMDSYFYPLSPSTTNNSSIQQWQPSNIPPLNISTATARPILTSSLTTTATITPVTPNIIQLQVKETSQHARSRSAGTASDFFSSIQSNPYQVAQSPEIEEPLQSSRSSLSLHELNTGQSLLLTQKFVYQSPSVRSQELSNKNPFTPTPTKELMTSPFDDVVVEADESIIVTPKSDSTREERQINNKPNKYSIPPPPVPHQSTKPAFPKYTRTNSFLIKRRQSTTGTPAAAANHNLLLQRHKSTTSTNMFY